MKMREHEAPHAGARRDLAGGVRAGERVLRHGSDMFVRRELRAREIAALQVQVGIGRNAYERVVHDAVAAEREDAALGLDAKAKTDPTRTKALVKWQAVTVLHLLASHSVFGRFHDG